MLDEIHNKYRSKVDFYSLNVDDTDAMEIIQVSYDSLLVYIEILTISLLRN